MKKPIFYSQLGEDVFIFKNFINKIVKDGIFIELGALDGEKYSNSKFFEDNLGFTGILIEPTKNFNKLIINRPNCKNYNYAISNIEGENIFIGEDATAGIIDNIPEFMYNRYHKNKSSEYKVQGIPISKIINKSNIDYIDIYFIDVEGAELIVLDTTDWSIPIYLIIIELHNIDIEKDKKCRDLLLKKGFKFYTSLCSNEIWVNDNYKYKERLYDDTIKFPKINSLSEIGNFPFIERSFQNQIIKTLNETFLPS
jgi:FkbM family methyltransferase